MKQWADGVNRRLAWYGMLRREWWLTIKAYDSILIWYLSTAILNGFISE